MASTRRDFLSGLAALPLALPPKPPAIHRRVESPKGKEHRLSLQKRRVSAQIVTAPVKSTPMLETSRLAVGNVITAPVLTIEHLGNSAVISWAGGNGPFKIESSPDLKTWTTIAGPTMQKSITVPATGPNSDYRVVSSLVMGSSISRSNGITVFTWQTPSL